MSQGKPDPAVYYRATATGKAYIEAQLAREAEARRAIWLARLIICIFCFEERIPEARAIEQSSRVLRLCIGVLGLSGLWTLTILLSLLPEHLALTQRLSLAMSVVTFPLWLLIPWIVPYEPNRK
jgi:hypothetical protein